MQARAVHMPISMKSNGGSHGSVRRDQTGDGGSRGYTATQLRSPAPSRMTTG